MQLSLRAENYTNVWTIEEIMNILNCSKSLHTNDVRSGFLLLRAMFPSLFVLFTANLKGAQENESGFADLYQDLEHLMNSYNTEREAHRIKQLPFIVSVCWKAQLPFCWHLSSQEGDAFETCPENFID